MYTHRPTDFRYTRLLPTVNKMLKTVSCSTDCDDCFVRDSIQPMSLPARPNYAG
jgi:hypothetical protein